MWDLSRRRLLLLLLLLCADGTIAVIGGVLSGSATTSIDGFFPRDVSWRHLGQLSRPRLGAAAVAVGDLIYVLGGTDEDGVPLQDGEAFNGRTGVAAPERAFPAPPGCAGALACVLACVRVPAGTVL